MLIFLTMLIIGVLLGVVGAGGSGFIISILTTIFGVPIHIALGTSLAAMAFSSFSGVYSQYRESNVVIRVGLLIGLFGIIGSFFGSRIANFIPPQELKWLTASMLFISSLLLWLRLFTQIGQFINTKSHQTRYTRGFKFWASVSSIGIVNGILSGVFGIGAASFIQIGLIIFIGLSVQQSVGTALIIVFPMAVVGGFGYFTIGNLDVILLIKVAAGTTVGSYVGAKFTARLPSIILKVLIVIVPAIGGLLLLFGK